MQLGRAHYPSCTPTRSTTRSNALAERLERGARALADFVSTLTEAEWQTRVPKDGRKIGVIVHHVATMYPVEIKLAQTLTAAESASHKQRHAVRHSYHHLARLQATLKK